MSYTYIRADKTIIIESIYPKINDGFISKASIKNKEVSTSTRCIIRISLPIVHISLG